MNSWKEGERGTWGGAGGQGDVFKASPSSRSSCLLSFPPEQPHSTRPRLR